MRNLVLIIYFLTLTSCAISHVKHQRETTYLKPDILIESKPSGADIFIYPTGIIAKTPFNANRIQLENANIEVRKDGYETQNIFVEKKESFLFFHTFFGNIILLPLYPFAVITDLINGWDLEKPADKITIELKKKK